MKRYVLTILLFASGSVALLAAPEPPVQQLLSTAQKQADLIGGSGEPFQLGMDFVADPRTGAGPSRGHFELKWEAKDRWWRQIDLGGFRMTEVRVATKLYTSRNAGYTPLAVREFLSLLEFAQVDERRSQLVVKEQKRCKKDGVKAFCIKGELATDAKERHDVVVSAAGGEILSHDWSSGPDQRRKEEFSNWVALDKYRYYPRNLQLTVNGAKIVTASVTNLTTAPFDETLLIPPHGAIASR
jgi:hypothetical protein